jgi:hypothetical protein
MELVICDHAGRMEYCKVCPHGKPHVPVRDECYGSGQSGQCDRSGGHCAGDEGYQDVFCVCVPAKQKQASTVRTIGLPIWGIAK